MARLMILLVLAALLIGCGAVEADEAMQELEADLEHIQEENVARMDAMARLLASYERKQEYDRRAWTAIWRYIDRKEAEDEDSE